MPQQKTDKRTKSLLVRLTPTEHAALKESAGHARLSAADYVRSLALSRPASRLAPRVASSEEKRLAHGLGLLADIGSEIQEMKLQISVGDTPLETTLDYALGQVVEASEAIMRALGAA